MTTDSLSFSFGNGDEVGLDNDVLAPDANGLCMTWPGRCSNRFRYRNVVMLSSYECISGATVATKMVRESGCIIDLCSTLVKIDSRNGLGTSFPASFNSIPRKTPLSAHNDLRITILRRRWLEWWLLALLITLSFSFDDLSSSHPANAKSTNWHEVVASRFDDRSGRATVGWWWWPQWTWIVTITCPRLDVRWVCRAAV